MGDFPNKPYGYSSRWRGVAHSVAKFRYTAGPESQVLERVDWFGRYFGMRLLERTEHAMTICGGTRWLSQVFLRVCTLPRDGAVDVTLEAWAIDWIGGEWNVDPRSFAGMFPRWRGWPYAVSLARYLGVEQPEKLFVHPEW